MNFRWLILFIPLVFLATAGCKKDKLYTKEHLDFSTDTVLFDTVFTTVGSTTKRFKVYNNNNAKILVNEIELMGGSSSPFRINIDGVSGTYHQDIEIPKNDSIFAFVEVTLAVNNTTNPLVISDSIRFMTNGLNQYVKLDVWGQDAYFHANEVVSGTWANDKPHVLYGIVAVGYPGIDSNLTLTIPQGTNVYCHKDSRLLVYKSSLDIQGQLDNEVTFQGDRLESFYDDVPGQWYGIHLIEANTSTINYAFIKNGAVGITVDSTQALQTLNLTNSVVQNSDFFNLNVNAGGVVDVDNCVFGDAGAYSVLLYVGGEYNFRNCTVANYWPGSRVGPSVVIINWYEDANNNIHVRPVTNSRFDNCVFYGTAVDELAVDTIPGATFDCVFNKCHIKRETIYAYANFSNVSWNTDPLFTAPGDADFHFEVGSPLDNTADPAWATTLDIEGTARNMGAPDIGAYERL
ncbi:MAG: hypothetical protein HYZ14_19190 [Bacteroidetes bacterium]|nr:hypothetical protein [Bacteroidota bacterium]